MHHHDLSRPHHPAIHHPQPFPALRTACLPIASSRQPPGSHHPSTGTKTGKPHRIYRLTNLSPGSVSSIPHTISVAPAHLTPITPRISAVVDVFSPELAYAEIRPTLSFPQLRGLPLRRTSNPRQARPNLSLLPLGIPRMPGLRANLPRAESPQIRPSQRPRRRAAEHRSGHRDRSPPRRCLASPCQDDLAKVLQSVRLIPVRQPTQRRLAAL